uniref:NEDD8-conjugating enzyme UBC12 n=1 Tax=Strix occidentalis caurina TaxID=311401 RepID=A0A8D0EXU7_STROC
GHRLLPVRPQEAGVRHTGWPRCPCPRVSPRPPRVHPPDINELNLPKTCEIDFSDQDDLLHFRLLICPDEVGQGYPHDPPKVKCETMVYHPNIDLEGNVCLNILREDWKPVLTINSIIYGLQYLFLVSPAGARCPQPHILPPLDTPMGGIRGQFPALGCIK